MTKYHPNIFVFSKEAVRTDDAALQWDDNVRNLVSIPSIFLSQKSL